MIVVLLGGVVLDLSMSLWFILYIYFADKYTSYLYAKGIIKRSRSSPIQTPGVLYVVVVLYVLVFLVVFIISLLLGFYVCLGRKKELLMENFKVAVLTFTIPSMYVSIVCAVEK